MRLIVSNWRLKLLALALSLGLLGAVAFSQDPITLSSPAVRISYEASRLPSGLALVNPPPTVPVTVAGLRSTISGLVPSNILIVPDLSHARPGPMTVTAAPVVQVPGVTLEAGTVTIALDVETVHTAALQVAVKANTAPGVTLDPNKTFAVCGDTLAPCVVHVTAPSSFLQGLTASVIYGTTIQADASISAANFQVQFQQNGHAVDFGSLNVYPTPTVDHAVVDVHIVAVGASASRSVALRVQVANSPPCGYAISSINVLPTWVVQVSGPSAGVFALTSIPLAPIDLSGLTSSETVTRAVSTGDPAIHADVSSVQVQVTPANNCPPPAKATPTPTPSPGASPGP